MIITELRQSGRIPRLHGNGFIELDLNEEGTRRLHVWPFPKLSAQKIDSSIHDHAWDMESQVYLGQIHHRTFTAEPHINGLFNVYRAIPRDKEDTELVKEKGRVLVKQLDVIFVSAGESYFLSALHLHSSQWYGLSLSIITKSNMLDSRPRVLCLDKTEPDNDFSRYSIDTEILWNSIEEALFRAKNLPKNIIE